MAITREDVVSEALALLDAEGLDGITLRRLADRLGVKAPTLYWHVASKREVLDLLAQRIMDDALGTDRSIPPGEAWWEWMYERGRRMRAGLLAHRDAALVVAGNRPPPASLPAIETQLRCLTEAGFTPSDALLAVLSMASFVIGSVIDLQREAERRTSRPRGATPPRRGAPGRPSARFEDHPDERQWDVPGDHPRPALDRQRYPTVAAAFEGVRAGPEDIRFEWGLRAIIDGMRARCHDPVL